jgi:kynurenine--oxoglutarate transaminase/cysteine-S-conjugate beta-lyase/glutamine--phenylpyruvate transaminase
MIEKSLKQENSMLHQYTRSSGHLRLVNGIAECYGQFLNRKIDPLTEVLVTCGAYGSLFNCLKGFIEKGDEVLFID